MLVRLSSWCYRRRRIVAIAWVALVIGVGASAGAIGTRSDDDPASRNSESQAGFDVIDEYFGGFGSGQEGSIVFRSAGGVDDPAVRNAMENVFAEADAIDGVTITSPYDERGFGQISEDGTVAFASVSLDRDIDMGESGSYGHQIEELLPRIDGVQIELGGEALADFEPPDSELIGIAFAIVVLIFAFGSVLAMGLPIGVALAGVGTGLGGIVLLSNLVTVPTFATSLGAMIGLGVGIDYALFIVTRYREGLHRGLDTHDATVAAMDSAGRAVIFAGLTVVISLLGMLTMGLPFVSGLGMAAALTVLVTMAASITLLPALLGFAGHRIELTRVRGLVAAGLIAVALLGAGLSLSPLLLGAPLAVVVLAAGFAIAPLRKEVPHRVAKPLRETFWYRWSHLIQRRPWVSAITGAVILLVLSIPVLGLRLGFSDEGNFATSTTTRRAYDMLADGFGPGFNGPLLITAEFSSPGDAAGLEALTAAVAGDAGVQAVAPPQLDDPDAPVAAFFRVIPTTGPQDADTTSLVKRLRSDVIPNAIGDTSTTVNVTGSVAGSVDFTDYLSGRLPFFFGIVLLLSFLLLMAVFRSLLVPLKAVIMNLLSIGASYGVIVAIFQWGWASNIIGVANGGPIEPFIPMMLFAIVFGLSMDYEVFLLSRIKEEYDRTGDARNSVADGLAATAQVITAAAAIMVVVFGSFVFEDDRIIKLFGFGLATAVLLDATLVRMLLVPATMELLGDRNWWLPRWLDRVLPRISVEGEQPTDGAVEPEERVPSPL